MKKKNLKQIIAGSIIIIPTILAMSNSNAEKANAMIGSSLRGAFNRVMSNMPKINLNVNKPSGLKVNTQNLSGALGMNKNTGNTARYPNMNPVNTQGNRTGSLPTNQSSSSVSRPTLNVNMNRGSLRPTSSAGTTSNMVNNHEGPTSNPNGLPKIALDLKKAVTDFEKTRTNQNNNQGPTSNPNGLPKIALDLKKAVADFEETRKNNGPNNSPSAPKINLNRTNLNDMANDIKGIVSDFESTRAANRSQSLNIRNNNGSNIPNIHKSSSLPSNLTRRN